MLNLLAGLFEDWPKFDIGEGAFYAVFGFVFVFLGIALLIAFFTALGAIMKKVNARKAEKKEMAKKERHRETPSVPQPVVDAGISSETVAVIAAALMAYYEAAPGKCDFVVRRIKRL